MVLTLLNQTTILVAGKLFTQSQLLMVKLQNLTSVMKTKQVRKKLMMKNTVKT